MAIGAESKKIFWISFCIIFTAQAIFRIEYIDLGIENLVFYLVIAVLLAVAVTLVWKQFKKN
jgi:hypothetical protein